MLELALLDLVLDVAGEEIGLDLAEFGRGDDGQDIAESHAILFHLFK